MEIVVIESALVDRNVSWDAGMPISIVEIARLANVSPSTVSKALGGKYAVSTSTRNRIREIADRFGYVPSQAGRALVLGKTNTICIYFNHGSVPHDTLRVMLDGANSYLSEAGYNLAVVTKPAQADAHSQIMRQQFTDGVVIAHDREQQLEDYLEKSQTPFVLLNVEPSEAHDCVVTDNIGGVFLAVEHLVRLGHRRIAFINTFKGNDAHVSSKLRARGYVDAMAEHGLLTVPGYNECIDVEEQLSRVLSFKEPPTGLICYNDLVAVMAHSYLKKNGINIPEEISLIGCDDSEEAIKYFTPALTTLRIAFAEMGLQVAKLLIKRINGFTGPAELVVTPQQLVVRESTGPGPHAAERPRRPRSASGS